MKKKWKLNLKNVLASVLCVAMGVSVVGGCGTAQKETLPENEDAVESEASDVEEEQEAVGEEGQDVSVAEFKFADVTNLEFFFASGAGAWCTVMYIHEDGTFDGNYHDSDMGDTGEDYPYGTVYFCDFTGKFTQPEKVDDYTYSMQIENLANVSQVLFKSF